LKILLLTRYDCTGPSSRYRFYQFLPYLEKERFDVSVSPLFNEKYVYNLYSDQRAIKFLNPLGGYLKRISKSLFYHSYDLVWMEKEALPWIPQFIEKLLSQTSVPYVIDYDDAVFHRYDQHPNFLLRNLLSRKIEGIMARSTVVVAGNRYIADYAQRAGAQKVEILPTVLDLSRYRMKDTIDSPSFTIGWVGSPSTSRHIFVVAEALKDFCQKDNVEFRALGALQRDLDEIPGKLIPWNAETETEELTRFDVGIMPLPDTPWERGKCGFKLIQYMAAGLPVIASPVGVNSEIVEHGVNGFLARDTKEWIKYFEVLKGHPDLGREMGARGRKKVEEKYSLDVIAPRLISIFKEAVQA
jgi:glycosyltransferase involved in cell wall biosynthesis